MRRRGHPETIVIERGSSSPLLWFLVGGALGGGLALLFAPQSGDRTRRTIGRKLGKLRDAAEDALEDLKASLDPEEGVHRSLADADEVDEEVEVEADVDDASISAERAASPRRTTISARHELEQRLAKARARRRRALTEEDEEPVA